MNTSSSVVQCWSRTSTERALWHVICFPDPTNASSFPRTARNSNPCANGTYWRCRAVYGCSAWRFPLRGRRGSAWWNGNLPCDRPDDPRWVGALQVCGILGGASWWEGSFHMRQAGFGTTHCGARRDRVPSTRRILMGQMPLKGLGDLAQISRPRCASRPLRLRPKR